MSFSRFQRAKNGTRQDIKFPDHDNNEPSEVNIYYLSGDELEKYRKMPKPTGKDAKSSMAGIHELKKKKAKP